MEANFFRFLIQEIGPKLKGKRIEKVYQPWDGVWTFKLGPRLFLILRYEPKANALLLSSTRPENPAEPCSNVLWWRKRLKNKRIDYLECNWPKRSLALRLAPSLQWLVLDLSYGLKLLDELDLEFFNQPDWPGLYQIQSQDKIYKSYPQITPPLRRAIAYSSEQEAVALLNRLQKGKAPENYYLCKQKQGSCSVLPWRTKDLGEHCEQIQEVASAEEAAVLFGWEMLLSRDPGRQASENRIKRQVKRVQRNLEKLELDRSRMEDLLQCRELADMLKANLHFFDPQQRYTQVKVYDFSGNLINIELDKAETLLGNIEKFYKFYKKGNRGLSKINERMAALNRELEDLKKKRVSLSRVKGTGEQEVASVQEEKAQADKFKGLQVRVFVSTDGFKIIQGKNNKTNHRMLSQVAGQFDYWFHVQSGSGSHVILKRAHEHQLVPEQSMLQAAYLAAKYSSSSQEYKAEVLVALVRDVRKVKGMNRGEVRVDKVLKSLNLRLEPEIIQDLQQLK